MSAHFRKSVFWISTCSWKQVGSFCVCSSLFFFVSFFHGHWRYRTEVEEKWQFLILSTTSTDSRICKHLLSSLYLRCLPRIFNQGSCNYQTGTLWDLFTSGNWYLIEGNYIVDIKYFINLSLTKCGFDLASLVLVLLAHQLTTC